MQHDDEGDGTASPALLQQTVVGRPGSGDVPAAMTSATQTYTEVDHQRMTRALELLDRSSLFATPKANEGDAPGDGPSGDDASGGQEAQKYEPVAAIGHGGMGDVYEVRDVDLNRTVALKRIRGDVITARAQKLFIQEAQVTAQLEHPNIVPVHDSGRTTSGEAYFTMKRLRGWNLRQVLMNLAGGHPETVRRFTRIRLGITFLEVVRAVAYAHARGVVHCDLKPSNVFIGEHDEVMVGDWGLARQDPLSPPVPDVPPVSFPPDAPEHEGVVSGSMPYMAPEQVAGNAVDRRADVYSLGAILYEMLTLQPLFRVASIGELAQRIRAGIVPPRERAPYLEISEEIEAICMKCLEAQPDRRYQSAGELQEAIEGWLTGTRRRELALAAFHDGEIARAHLEALDAERCILEEEQRRLEEHIKPFDPEQKKQPLWKVEDRLFEVALEREEVLARALDAWARSASLDDGFLAPRDRLAEFHLQLFLEAEQRGKKLEEQLHRRQVERHHRGRYAAILEGIGVVSLRPRTAHATIHGFRLKEQGKKIVIADRLELPRADVVTDLALPMGSYLFEVEAPGLQNAKVHVLVGRGSRIDLEPRLFSDEEIGEGFVHVPAGSYIAGGDETALNSEPRIERSLPDFFIARTAVTCAEYARFLNDLVDESPHLARQHVPRTRPDGGALWEPGPDGRYVVPRFDADGNPMHPDAPVMGVSFFDAEMYASWLARKESAPYRLPTEHEWEKAARGADGRFFPWGNGFDPSFCKMALSRPGRPQPEPVGSFPVDESVYGMRDAAGAIREWCDSFFDPGRETRTLRGGAWYFNPHYCRLAFRHGYLPHVVFTNFGFRLAKSVL